MAKIGCKTAYDSERAMLYDPERFSTIGGRILSHTYQSNDRIRQPCSNALAEVSQCGRAEMKG